MLQTLFENIFVKTFQLSKDIDEIRMFSFFFFFFLFSFFLSFFSFFFLKRAQVVLTTHNPNPRR